MPVQGASISTHSIRLALGSAHLDVARAGSRQARVDGRQAPLVVVGRIDLAAVLHESCERKCLAAGTGAKIDHVLAGARLRQKSGKLRALVLHLDPPLDEGGLGMDRRVLGLGAKRNAQAPRRPAGRHGAKMRERGLRARTIRLERIDAQIERRAACERRALGGALLAEHTGKMRIEPLRIIAGNPRRRAGEACLFERRALGLR
jgi:hypothetical protein